MEYKNEVVLHGEIVRDLEFSHEYDGKPFYSTDLKLLNSRNNRRGLPIVRCYFCGDQLASKAVSPGTLVNLSGKLVNSKIKGIIDISVLIENYDIVDKLDSEAEDNITLSGEVTKIFTTKDNYKGFINFVIADIDENENKLFSSRVVIWNRLGKFVLNNTKVGDKVLVKGVINNSTTKSRPEDDEEIEDIIVSEILGEFFINLNSDDQS